MRALALVAFAAVCLSGSASANERRPVGLELALAVDCSLSVDAREFDLQLSGIARAFADAAVVDAILSHDGVAVSLLLWSNNTQQKAAIGWTLLHDRDSIAAFAARVANAKRVISSGATGIGPALIYAMREIDENAFAGTRRVIDVSGDGRNNIGIGPAVVRDSAAVRGFTVNGLAILDKEPWLDRYYADNVIGGPGAFLEIATDYEAFAVAVRRKLLREIGGRSVAFEGSAGPYAEIDG